MSDEETLAPSPRDRSRTRVTPSRQPLVAVGRVASRVRTSGISKIPSSILARGKEEAQHTNTSPWGVKNDKTPKAPRTSEFHLDADYPEKKKISPISPKEPGPVTSPLSSSSQQETLADADRGIRRRKTVNISGTGYNKSTTKGDNYGNQHGSEMAKSTSRKGTRPADSNVTDTSSTMSSTASNDLKKGKSGTFNTGFLMRGVSKLIFRGGGGEIEGKSTVSNGQQEKGSSQSSVSPVSDEFESDFDGKPSPKQQRSSLSLGIHRDKIKQSTGRSKSKALVTPKGQQNAPHNKSRAAVEMTKGLARSISTVARTPLEIGRDKNRAPTVSKGNNNSDTKLRKDDEQKVRKPRASWFGFGRGDSYDAENAKRGSHKRGKSRVRALSSPQKIGDASSSGLSKRRSPKGLDKVVDFAVDDYFDSEEDEIEAGANVRSLAEDDFISYQTRQLRKGERGKNR